MRWIRHKLVLYLTRNLLVALTEDEILTMTNRGWSYRGRMLSPEERAQLREEAQTFGDSLLWQMISNEIRFTANLRVFEKGVDAEQTIFGRAMLYNLELIATFIKNLKSK